VQIADEAVAKQPKEQEKDGTGEIKMKTIFTIIGAMIILVANPAYNKWRHIQEPVTKEVTIENYNEIIERMENGIKELKAEKQELQQSKEKDTYVSLWALWEAGKQLERINPPRDSIFENSAYFTVIYTICPEQFQEWLDKAIELDEELHNDKLYDVNLYISTTTNERNLK